jgi:hypothetical protein
VALADALRKPTQTVLTHLDLINVGRLSSLVYQGRFEQLQLNLSENRAITTQGIVALARAIETRGLPKLND